MKKIIAAFCYLLLIGATSMYAQNAAVAKHPNLSKAMSNVDMAYEKILDAQKANEYDLGGHAEKAKNLLEQAKSELKLAAEAAGAGDKDNQGNVKRPEDVPEPNVSASKRPNIAKAQALIQSAYESVVNAQQANEYDLGGHAEKAKNLLEQANQELKLAAQAANENK